DKPEIVALTKADALTPDQIKQQVARLKRAAKKEPLVISAVAGAGVPDALRKLLAVIDAAQADETRAHPTPAWHPEPSLRGRPATRSPLILSRIQGIVNLMQNSSKYLLHSTL